METSFVVTDGQKYYCYLHNRKISQRLLVKSPSSNNKRVSQNQILQPSLRIRWVNEYTARAGHEKVKI